MIVVLQGSYSFKLTGFGQKNTLSAEPESSLLMLLSCRFGRQTFSGCRSSVDISRSILFQTNCLKIVSFGPGRGYFALLGGKCPGYMRFAASTGIILASFLIRLPVPSVLSVRSNTPEKTGYINVWLHTHTYNDSIDLCLSTAARESRFYSCLANLRLEQPDSGMKAGTEDSKAWPSACGLHLDRADRLWLGMEILVSMRMAGVTSTVFGNVFHHHALPISTMSDLNASPPPSITRQYGSDGKRVPRAAQSGYMSKLVSKIRGKRSTQTEENPNVSNYTPTALSITPVVSDYVSFGRFAPFSTPGASSSRLFPSHVPAITTGASISASSTPSTPPTMSESNAPPPPLLPLPQLPPVASSTSALSSSLASKSGTSSGAWPVQETLPARQPPWRVMDTLSSRRIRNPYRTFHHILRSLQRQMVRRARRPRQLPSRTQRLFLDLPAEHMQPDQRAR